MHVTVLLGVDFVNAKSAKTTVSMFAKTVADSNYISYCSVDFVSLNSGSESC